METRKESVDAFLDGRNHEKYHYFCCSSGSSGNIYSFVLSHCCRKSGREKKLTEIMRKEEEQNED